MPHVHVTEDEVSRFVSGRLQGPELRALVRQALGSCRTCRRRLGSYAPVLQEEEEAPPPEARAETGASYDAALDRAIAGLARHGALWEEERALIPKLEARARDVMAGSAGDDDDGHLDDHYWAWIEAQMKLSFELRFRDPEEMLLLAWGAALAARKLGTLERDCARWTSAQIADLRARTLIELANARRLNHLYRDAEEALEEAAGFLEEGKADLLTVGRLFDVQASLRMDERKLEEALDLLGTLHRHYLAFGETHLAGRALIKKGIALHYDDRPLEAVPMLREGIASLTPARDAKLLATGEQALLHALVGAGNHHAAGKLLMESGLRQAFADDPLNLLKLRWVEGKIFAGLGKLRRAEAIFLEVKEEFLLRDREYLAAMLCLEIVQVLLRQNRTDEVEPLAQEAWEIFKDLKVDREALRAVRYFRDACRQKLATTGLARQVVTFLTRLERQPGLRFAP